MYLINDIIGTDFITWSLLTYGVVFERLLLVVRFGEEVREHLVQPRSRVRLELPPQQLDRLVRAHLLQKWTSYFKQVISALKYRLFGIHTVLFTQDTVDILIYSATGQDVVIWKEERGSRG